ncbi:hypothetical protein K523DRAFT_364659 [Schizophyllum commune Tattone D]|nr:hypothetical protein K523DRAFT_364659 [Schizophyllum commune Tattone D]
MPSGVPVDPSYQKARHKAEQARCMATTYEGNIRNFEDKWYAFWLRWFELWAFWIKCDSNVTSQDSSWIKKGLDIEKARARVKIVPKSFSDSLGDHISAPAEDDSGGGDDADDDADDEEEERMGVEAFNAEEPLGAPMLRTKKNTESGERGSEGHSSLNRVDNLPEELQSISHGISTASHDSHDSQKTEAGKAESIQRIPDTVIRLYYTPGLTASSAAAVMEHRLRLANAPDKGTAKNESRPSGYPVNPMKSYRVVGAHKKAVDFAAVMGEHKGNPGRRLKPPKWHNAHKGSMLEGQDGAMLQTAVLLLASVGDTWTHSIMRRVDYVGGGYKIEMEEWSSPVIAGSPLSDMREDKLIEWINNTFPEDLGELIRNPPVPREETPEPEGDAPPEQAPTKKKRRRTHDDQPRREYNLRSQRPRGNDDPPPAKRLRQASTKQASKTTAEDPAVGRGRKKARR